VTAVFLKNHEKYILHPGTYESHINVVIPADYFFWGEGGGGGSNTLNLSVLLEITHKFKI
jgi:hypothetical protein